MTSTVTSLAAVVVLVVAAAAAPGPGHYHPEHQSLIQPYRFNYNIDDEHGSGVHMGQNAKSDGRSVTGTYCLDLPDGRRQTVRYVADHHGGYVARVTYEGRAHHPRHHGNNIPGNPFTAFRAYQRYPHQDDDQDDDQDDHAQFPYYHPILDYDPDHHHHQGHGRDY